MNLQKLPRGVSTLALVFILFFCTSGGPYTTETLIHSVGPGLGLLMLLLVPIVWSIPEVLRLQAPRIGTLAGATVVDCGLCLRIPHQLKFQRQRFVLCYSRPAREEFRSCR
jgi:hypothetical protein